jgi:Cdc6-like AAA superfamily ATPase
MTQNIPHIYIAYSPHENQDFVNQFIPRLEQQGFRVWEFRRSDLVRDWHPSSIQAMQEAFALLVVYGPIIGVSRNVNWEIGSARELGVPIFGVQTANIPEQPQQLYQTPQFDFTNPADTWPRLVATLYQTAETRGVPIKADPPIPWSPNTPNKASKQQATEPHTDPLPPNYLTLEGANNDTVAREDQLEFKHYVKAFVEIIRSPHTQPPLTIGIYGSWGMGKSFLLENIARQLNETNTQVDDRLPRWLRPIYQLERRLKKAPQLIRFLLLPISLPIRLTGATIRLFQVKVLGHKLPPVSPTVHIVTFNAWEFSATEIIWPGLVQKIMDKLENQTAFVFPSLFLIKVLRSLKSHVSQARGTYLVIALLVIILLATVTWMYQYGQVTVDERILQGTLVLVASGGLIGILKVIHDAITPMGTWVTKLIQERDYGKQIGYMEEIRLDLEFLERRLQRDKGRILIIIDDLDRCEPEKAVEMLQAVKLLLNFNSFIVMMGIDSRIITGAVEKHYQGLLSSTGASGYEYLDKIVQIPFRIPEPTSDEIRSFIVKQMQVLPGESPDSPASTAATTVSTNTGTAPSGDAPTTPAPASGSSGYGAAPTAPAQQAQPQTITIDFVREERDAFQEIAEYLRPNPRHIKRIMNVYRLVRELAKSKEAADPKGAYRSRVLQDREAAIRWLVISGQWPYIAYMMLEKFKEELARSATGTFPLQPGDDLLLHLYDSTVSDTSRFSSKKCDRLDYNKVVLREMLEKFSKAKPNWMEPEELYEMRRYTINFNPAIESDLQDEQPQPPKPQVKITPIYRPLYATSRPGWNAKDGTEQPNDVIKK